MILDDYAATLDSLGREDENFRRFRNCLEEILTIDSFKDPFADKILSSDLKLYNNSLAFINYLIWNDAHTLFKPEDRKQLDYLLERIDDPSLILISQHLENPVKAMPQILLETQKGEKLGSEVAKVFSSKLKELNSTNLSWEDLGLAITHTIRASAENSILHALVGNSSDDLINNMSQRDKNNVLFLIRLRLILKLVQAKGNFN